MLTCDLQLTTKYITEHDDFLNGTPSDYIIYKTLCGLGATHGEALIYKRNSIILLPNTPVLIGKKTAREEDGSLSYPNIFIVYEDVNVESLIDYLNDEAIQYKKILCTPEAYKYKVRNAIIANNKFDLYRDFFMLIDECDSLVKTVFFRGKIVSPLTDFFQFENKAMISATPIIPSDPRFEENNFKILKVIPQFDYKKHIDIIHTNNISASLKYALQNTDDEPKFIFLNSTKLSVKLIRKLGIEKDSQIYCSEEKVGELRRKLDFRNSGSEIKVEKLKKYNFLTSRFFSALDIKLDIKPKVIMITDLHRAPFSLLDPYSDSIQIVGRFRNGVKDITHITNTKIDIEYKTREQATKYIDESFECYKLLLEVRRNVNTHFGIETAKQALERTDIHKFANDDHSMNYFACDSFHLHQQIKRYYKEISLLGQAYIDTNYFIPKVMERLYDADDAIVEMLDDEELSKAKISECVATLFLFYHNRNHNETIPYVDTELYSKLRNDYPKQAEYFDELGFIKMRELEFNDLRMNQLLKKITNERVKDDPFTRETIHSLYTIGDRVLKEECRCAIKDIYIEFGLVCKVKATEVKRFFDVKDTTVDTEHGKKHAWLIIKLI